MAILSATARFILDIIAVTAKNSVSLVTKRPDRLTGSVKIYYLQKLKHIYNFKPLRKAWIAYTQGLWRVIGQLTNPPYINYFARIQINSRNLDVAISTMQLLIIWTIVKQTSIVNHKMPRQSMKGLEGIDEF